MNTPNNSNSDPHAPPPAGPAPQVPGATANPDPTLHGTTFEYTCLNPRGGFRTERVTVISPRFLPKVQP